MAAEEGRVPWIRNISEEDIAEFDPQNTDSTATAQGSGNGIERTNGGNGAAKPPRL